MFMPRALHRIAAALLLWCMAIIVITVPVQTAVTFGTSLKGQGFYCGHEQTVFQRPCTAAEAPCTMQHYWSGGFFPEYGASLLRYYVDGEGTASVVLPLGLAHGMAADMDDNAPWNAGGIMGKTGVGYPGWGASPDAGAGRPASASAATQNVTGAGGSGLFNNFQIPFGSNISVTVEMVGEKGHLVIFWLVLRGRTKADALHLPGTPSVPLPRTARLRTHYSANVTLQPLQQLTLYNTTAANGAVLMVTVAVDSAPSNLYPAYHYLEGCMRAFTPAGEQRYRISSGTEDYFLGTFYFVRLLRAAALCLATVEPSGPLLCFSLHLSISYSGVHTLCFI